MNRSIGYLFIFVLLSMTFQPFSRTGAAPTFKPPMLQGFRLDDGAVSAAAGARTRSAAPAAVEWTFHKTGDNLHPNGREQLMVWLMNRARANPPDEGAWLATSSDPDISGPRAYFGVNTTTLQNEFAGYGPTPPAAFDARLYEAAKIHSEDLIERDSQDHTGQFAAVAARFQCAGGSGNSYRGNVFAFADSALNAHAAWNIDWGAGPGGMQPERGHRRAVMALDGEYTNVGIAVVNENNSQTQVGPFVTTGNYCHAQAGASNHYNRFLVGTVWQDLDGDQLYDLGEGIAGVTVTPLGAEFFAVTANSGGYAIPITQAGSYTVNFSGGVTGVRAVTVANTSVALDYQHAFSLGDELLYLPLTLLRP